MTAILVPIEDTERERVRQAARQAGLSQRQFCRQAILAAAESSGSMIAMLREVHRAVCDQPKSAEAEAAKAALVQMGIPPKDARRRVAAVIKEHPKGKAEELIRKVLTNGTQR